MNEPLQFNIAKKTVRPVVLESEDGTRTHYELREMTVAQKEAHMTAAARRVRYNDKGEVVGYTGFDGASADILTRSMWVIGKSKEGQQMVALDKPVLVKAEEVAQWPSSATAQIVDAAQQLNKIQKPDLEEQAAKNV